MSWGMSRLISEITGDFQPFYSNTIEILMSLPTYLLHFHFLSVLPMFQISAPAVRWSPLSAVISTRERLGVKKRSSCFLKRISFKWLRSASEIGGSSSTICLLKTRPLFESSWRVQQQLQVPVLVYLEITNRYG